MAHIHLPDGSFSLIWVLTYFIIAAIIIVVVLIWYHRGKEVSSEKLAITGILAAISFVVFQIEIPAPWGGTHLNFTPIIGILIGPGLGILVSLVINIISAAIGHGGWTIIGANTIINAVEVVISWGIYNILAKKNINKFSSAAIATAMGLTAGTFILTLLIGIAGIQGYYQSGLTLMGSLWLLNIANLVIAGIEAIFTGFIISYIGKVRPDIIAVD